MNDAAFSALAKQLGVDVGRLDGLATLAQDQVDHLDSCIAHAMESAEAAFDAGLEDSLTLVPRPLRGVARTLLFPGGQRG